MYYSTNIPDLVVDIMFKELRDGRIRASAIGIRPSDETQYAELGRVHSKPYSLKRREFAVNRVIMELESRYLALYGQLPADETAMRSAFERVKDAVFRDHLRLQPHWKCESTNKKVITFFERNVLSLLLPFSDPSKRMFLPSDREAIERQLVSLAERHSRGNHGDAKESAYKRLREADIIYAHIRDQDDRLPSLRLCPGEPPARAPKPEQLKSLPRSVLSRFYSKLSEMIEADPRFVFFAVLVVYGLRPAEAAARKPSDLIWYETCCTAEVSSQERNGILDPKLKNNYSRRIIIISYWGAQLLKRCCELIGDDYPHDDRAMNIAFDCALRVKQLLLECGCDKALFGDTEAAVSDDDLDTDDEHDKTNHLKHAKVSCYVLRRVFATIARNVMGLSLYETDRLLGHIPAGENGKQTTRLDHIDLNTADAQQAIAAKMERYIFDPRLSLNPACHPYTLAKKEAIPLIEFSEYIITNDSKMPQTLNLNLSAAEAGESVSIEMPPGITHTLDSVSTPKSWTDHSRTVIGNTTLKE